MFLISVYKDPLLMTAQALSVVAFIFSFGGVAAVAFGLAAMVVLQVVWCCRMNKCGLNAAASFALVVAILNAILAAVLALEEADESCNNDDDYSYRYDDDDDCNSSVQIWAILLFLSAGLWVAVSTLVFIFANTKRYHTCREKSEPAAAPKNNDDTKKDQTKTTVVATTSSVPPVMTTATPVTSSVEVTTTTSTPEPTTANDDDDDDDDDDDNALSVAAMTESQKSKTTIETTVFPDGTRKSVTTTFHPDGSKTITETRESETA